MNEFQTLIDKVTALKDEHRQLELALPRLAELKRQAQADVDALNKELAECLTRLDESTQAVADSGTVLAQERETHLNALKQDTAAFAVQCSRKRRELDSTEQELVAQAAKLRETEAVLIAREVDVATAEARVLADQSNLAQRLAVVSDQEEVAQAATEAATARAADLDGRRAATEAREAAVEAAEAETAELLRQAQATATDAQRLMAKATNHAITVEAKENELIKRETALATRKAHLDQREIGIRDKELVRESHVL